MSIIVNTNVPSINAQRSLTSTVKSLNRSLERLASGLRINRAGDDAAGLAIADGLSAQIRGLNQAVRNAGDGLSLIGMAEGAITTSTEILQRIRELAVQAANGVNSSANLSAIQAEIGAQIEELNRIGNTVEFNGQLLLNGSFANKKLQVGAKVGQTVSMSIDDFRASSLGKVAAVTTGAVAVGQAIDGTANGTLSINGVTVGPSAGLDTVSSASADQSAIAKAEAINAVSGRTGVTATVNATTVQGGNVAAGTFAAGQSMVINGIVIADSTNPVTVLVGDSNNALRNAINAKSNQTGVVASMTTAGQITLTAADGRNIALTVTAAAYTGFATSTTTASLKLNGQDAFTVNSGSANLIGLASGAVSVSLDPNSAVNKIDVTATDGAANAIRIIDSALVQVSKSRSSLGAITNRLENTISNLQTTVENLSASRSRILDADFAKETAELTRAQILQQAGVAVLSQANVSPQAALALLG